MFVSYRVGFSACDLVTFCFWGGEFFVDGGGHESL